VGNALFIPFFLLSVGMLVDPAVLVQSTRVWAIAGTITVLVHVGKLAGALVPQRIFGFSRAEAMVSFGLSLPQAAATLAVTFVGLEIGLFDEEVVNAVVIMILITGLVGPSLVERFGHQVAREEEGKPFDPGEAPQRILVPMANPATADDLMDLALLVREPDTSEPLHPMMVVPAESGDEQIAFAEKMLGHAVAYATAADVPVVPLTRMDHNFANGIARGAAEVRASTMIIGWDGQRSPRRGVFGSVLDQLLEHSKQQVLVCKLGHPLNTTERVVLVVPEGADHTLGFLEAAQTIKRLTNRLGARIHGYVVGTEEAALYEEHFKRVRPEAPTAFQAVGNWPEMLARLRLDVRADDLVVVLSARRGAVSWAPALERLPGLLASLVPESFIMMYPSEAIPTAAKQAAALETGPPPAVLTPQRLVLDAGDGSSYEALIRQLLETEFAGQPERLREIHAELMETQGLAAEIRPGVLVPHARVEGLRRSLLFLGVCRDGLKLPQSEEPVRLLFLLLTPRERPEEHLSNLSAVARLISDPERMHRMIAAADAGELLGAARG
jgi:mannitol/fructose-specific phosphotransferase system IIA component (Ntr-type)/nucleotide-binding universal stress UspA family protein